MADAEVTSESVSYRGLVRLPRG